MNQNSTSNGPWDQPGPEQLHEPGVAEAANKHSAEVAFKPIGSTNPGFRPLNQRLCILGGAIDSLLAVVSRMFCSDYFLFFDKFKYLFFLIITYFYKVNS